MLERERESGFMVEASADAPQLSGVNACEAVVSSPPRGFRSYTLAIGPSERKGRSVFQLLGVGRPAGQTPGPLRSAAPAPAFPSPHIKPVA